MPIMDVRYAKGSLAKTTKADVARRLTDVLIQMEGGANTRRGRGFAAVFFTEFDEDDWWIGGATGTTEPGKNIQTVINEVTEGNWGNAGKPISLESIAASVGQPPNGERMKWSHSYFMAKARAIDDAGYPVGVGGVVPSLSRDPAAAK
jgi:phenylpyruvate tautomerase PptA (4-oxalocrotonate tautomerase family)